LPGLRLLDPNALRNHPSPGGQAPGYTLPPFLPLPSSVTKAGGQLGTTAFVPRTQLPTPGS
jgi:hypothetical protein